MSSLGKRRARRGSTDESEAVPKVARSAPPEDGAAETRNYLGDSEESAYATSARHIRRLNG